MTHEEEEKEEVEEEEEEEEEEGTKDWKTSNRNTFNKV
jgi:hypothetical protein